MPFSILIWVVLGCLFVPATAQSQTNELTTVEISEIMPNPESGKEWVELYNPNLENFDLTGWKLCDGRTTTCTIVELSGTIEPESWRTYYLSSSFLNNSGDSVLLKNASGTIVASMHYGKGVPVPPRGSSLIWLDSTWKSTLTPTPDAENVLTEPIAPIDNNAKIEYSPPLVSAPEPKPIVPTIKPTVIPKPIPKIDPIRWEINAPWLIEQFQTTTLSAHKTADQFGGYIFYTWRFADGSNNEGTEIIHRFTTVGLQEIIVTASSTSGATSSHRFTIPIATRTSSIIISEINPNEEYVELYNPLNATTSLTGWKLATSNGDLFMFPSGTVFGAHNFRTLYKGATGLTLKDSGDTLYLLASTTTLADKLIFPTAKNALSYTYTDGAWKWSEPTPGIAYNPPEQTVLGEKITSTLAKTTSTAPTTLSIIETRSQPKGVLIKVRGIVAVLPTIFGSQFFYLVDATGGIQIYNHAKQFPHLNVGDRVTITGEMTTYQTIPRLKISTITHNSNGAPPLPEVRTIADIGENDIGKLLRITGDITDKKSTSLYIDDGEEELAVYFRSGAAVKRDHLREGDRITVTGIAEQTERGLQLWPRGSADIMLVTSTIQQTRDANTTHPQSKKILWLLFGATTLLVAILFLKTKKHTF